MKDIGIKMCVTGSILSLPVINGNQAVYEFRFV